MAIKNNIQDILDQRNIRAVALADTLGISTSQMSRLINGQRRLTYEWVLKICKALDVTADELIDTPQHMKVAATCDEALMQSVLMMVLDTCVSSRIKASSKQISKWVTYAYNEAATNRLTIKQTKALISSLVKVARGVGHDCLGCYGEAQ